MPTHTLVDSLPIHTTCLSCSFFNNVPETHTSVPMQCSGIDCTHPDLSDNCLSIRNPLSKLGDNTDVGTVFDVTTSKMISRSALPLQQDPDGHGTLVSNVFFFYLVANHYHISLIN